jgi:hypothetical protein
MISLGVIWAAPRRDYFCIQIQHSGTGQEGSCRQGARRRARVYSYPLCKWFGWQHLHVNRIRWQQLSVGANAVGGAKYRTTRNTLCSK